jgi:quinol monooxygenase YgiN
MAVSLFWRFQVGDFDSWLNPDPNGLAQMFKEQGMSAYSLHRNSDDPNAVMVHMQFADENTLNSFEAWYKVAKPEWEKQYPGSKHDIVMSWVGKDVPGYSRTL